MLNVTLRALLAYLIVCLHLFSSASPLSAARKPSNKIISKLEISLPERVTRPKMDQILKDFSAMVHAYRPEDRPLRIGIDIIINQTGISKELPSDLGFILRDVFGKIGKPFITYRMVPVSALPEGSAAATFASMQTDHPKPPPLDFVIGGDFRRFSEGSKLSKNAHGELLAGGRKSQADAQAGRDRTQTITPLTLALNVETPDRGSAGASAAYRAMVEHNETNSTFSLYIGGSGAGKDTKVSVTQELSDSLFDALGACAVTVLGEILGVPYYRLSPIFPVDEELDKSYLDSLNRSARVDLERTAKRFMYLGGNDMDLTSPDLTQEDRAVLVLAMQQRSLDFSDRKALVRFIFEYLWKSIDFIKAAQRADERLALISQAIAEAAAAEAARQAAVTRFGPADFGWPASVSMVVLDLSRVKDFEVREKIVAVASACHGCGEYKTDPAKTFAGIRLAKSSELLQALRISSLGLQYVWTDITQQHLLVSPKQLQ